MARPLSPEERREQRERQQAERSRAARLAEIAAMTPEQRAEAVARARKAARTQRADRDRRVADLRRQREEDRRPRVEISPPAERRQHERVERERQQVQDAHGSAGHPFRVVDSITAMRRSGTLTKRQADAAGLFRDDFDRAHLGSVKTMQLHRVSGGTDRRLDGDIDARRRIGTVMTLLGGHGTPSGAVAWHMVGEGMSARAFSERRGWQGRPLRKATVIGILIGVLDIIATEYAVPLDP